MDSKQKEDYLGGLGAPKIHQAKLFLGCQGPFKLLLGMEGDSEQEASDASANQNAYWKWEILLFLERSVLPMGRLLDQFGNRAIYDLGFAENVNVCEFISNGSWNFPAPTSNALIDIFWDGC